MGEFNADLDRGQLGHAAAAAISSRLRELDEVLGIMNQPQAAAAPDAEIDARVQAREEARKRRDWAAADQIRQERVQAREEARKRRDWAAAIKSATTGRPRASTSPTPPPAPAGGGRGEGGKILKSYFERLIP